MISSKTCRLTSRQQHDYLLRRLPRRKFSSMRRTRNPIPIRWLSMHAVSLPTMNDLSRRSYPILPVRSSAEFLCKVDKCCVGDIYRPLFRLFIPSRLFIRCPWHAALDHFSAPKTNLRCPPPSILSSWKSAGRNDQGVPGREGRHIGRTRRADPCGGRM